MGQFRVLTRDGRINFANRHSHINMSDLYHSMMTMTWWRLIAFVIFLYLGINLFFAAIYFIGGSEALAGTFHTTPIERFLDCFFFSVQTFATIGYGKITPQTLAANITVTIEAFSGLVSVALLTGVIFARFSKPKTMMLFSNIAVITHHNNIKQLMFRVSNIRMNRIVEANAVVTLSIDDVSAEGHAYRKLVDLKLERASTTLLGLSWTVRHPIEESSPLFNLNPEDLKSRHAEVLVVITGLDDSYGQTVNAVTSYIAEEIIDNARFVDIISRTKDGKVYVAHDKIHDYIKV
jgi:inward rectifier potassium channel